MKTLKRYAFGVLMTAALLSGGCGGGGGGGNKAVTPTTPVTGNSAAETQLGAANLPPDSGVTAASTLTSEDFSPDDSRSTATLSPVDMAPQ